MKQIDLGKSLDPNVQYTYSYSHREGRGELRQREGERGNSSHSWVENTNMNDCISSLLNSDEHLPQSPFTSNFFR
jgi:hypothetical protein